VANGKADWKFGTWNPVKSKIMHYVKRPLGGGGGGGGHTK